MWVLYIACDQLNEETSDEQRNNKRYAVASLRQAALSVTSVLQCVMRLSMHGGLVTQSMLSSLLRYT